MNYTNCVFKQRIKQEVTTSKGLWLIWNWRANLAIFENWVLGERSVHDMDLRLKLKNRLLKDQEWIPDQATRTCQAKELSLNWNLLTWTVLCPYSYDKGFKTTRKETCDLWFWLVIWGWCISGGSRSTDGSNKFGATYSVIVFMVQCSVYDFICQIYLHNIRLGKVLWKLVGKVFWMGEHIFSHVYQVMSRVWTNLYSILCDR